MKDLRPGIPGPDPNLLRNSLRKSEASTATSIGDHLCRLVLAKNRLSQNPQVDRHFRRATLSLEGLLKECE